MEWRPVAWAPSSREDERREMLHRMGLEDPMQLYRDVPRELLLEEPPRVGLGRPLSEAELRALADRLLSRNRLYTDPPPMIGGGWCPHYVPALVDYIVSRPELFSAYTPYQAEINQGLLQALFEYQSLIADLVELDIVNASMYDGSTAAAEALLMAMRVTRRQRIVLAGDISPLRKRVIETWLYGKGAEIVHVKPDTETMDVNIDELERAVTRDTAAVYIESPGFSGALSKQVEAAADLAHGRGALLVQGFEPLSLGIVKPPGRLGADIAVAEGQPLGLHMNYGGPGLGIFAVRHDRRLLRQLPGRLIGLTRDAEGGRAFTMILQTREQHIRREKATSNITTNEALMAIAAAVYLTLLGGEGLSRLARSIWLRSHYLAKLLSSHGLEAPTYSSEFFKEFTVNLGTMSRCVYEKGKREGYLLGLDVSKYGYPKGWRLLCVTELHSRHHLERAASIMAEAVEVCKGES